MPVYNAAQKVVSSFKVPVLSKYFKADNLYSGEVTQWDFLETCGHHLPFIVMKQGLCLFRGNLQPRLFGSP